MKKVYQTVGSLNHNLNLEIAGSDVRIDFTGGSRVPKTIFGKYHTSDKAIQEAIENHPLYGIEFKLIKIDDELVEKPQVILTKDELITQLEEKVATLTKEVEKLEKKLQGSKEFAETLKTSKEGVEEVPGDGVIKVEGITNAQQARDYLAEEYDVKKQSLPNPKSIINAAKKHNVEFVDWHYEE